MKKDSTNIFLYLFHNASSNLMKYTSHIFYFPRIKYDI